MQMCLGGRRTCTGWNVKVETPRAPRTEAPVTPEAPGTSAEKPRTESSRVQRSESTKAQYPGASVESLLRPAIDEDEEHPDRETFWVSPSLASWLTGKQRHGAQGYETVQSIIRNAVENRLDFADASKVGTNVDESTSAKKSGVNITVDSKSTDHAKWKKLIISGDPKKREKAVAIIKGLTSKCQNDTSASLIDTWQVFSDDRLKDDDAALSTRGHPQFGLVSIESQDDELNGRGSEPLAQKLPIAVFRRNLVSQSDIDYDFVTASIPVQVLKLDFPLAKLPLNISKHAFEVRLKHWLKDVLKSTKANSITVARVEANIDVGTYATADISVHDGGLEDLRTILLRNPPVVCDHVAVVPNKMVWCETCQQEHELHHRWDCYKYFHIDGRFDESLSSFVRSNTERVMA